MVLADQLPTDSVLRRHALTELNRQRGLPPTDAVLRRHFEQLQTMAASSPAQPAIAPRAASPAPSVAAPVAAKAAAPAAAPRAAPAPAAAPAGGGGLFGWLRRLFGG